MANHAEQKKFQILDSLRKGLLLKASLLQFQDRQAERSLSGAVELLDAIDAELQQARAVVRHTEADSAEEALCMAHIRALEDRRFDLLSLMHGSCLQAYNVPVSEKLSA